MVHENDGNHIQFLKVKKHHNYLTKNLYSLTFLKRGCPKSMKLMLFRQPFPLFISLIVIPF